MRRLINIDLFSDILAGSLNTLSTASILSRSPSQSSPSLHPLFPAFVLSV
jgi:hypothetical protein